jgi:phosphate-selective porin OprO/OprP
MTRIALTLAAALAAARLWAQTPAAGKPATAAAGAEGFVIQSEGGDYSLALRGYAQLDGRFYAGDDAGVATDQFLLRRVRPILQGTVAKHFDFNLTPDFGGGTAVIQDAYLDVRYSRKAWLRFGKFKVPLGLETLQSDTSIALVERALPSAVVPVRDVGAQVSGDLDGGVVSYAVGVFDGALDGASADLDTNDGKDLDARLFVSPFRKGSSRLKGLGIGIAGSVGDQTGALPSYRSGGQLTIASYVAGVTADGRRRRLAPQLWLYSGPFGLMAEYAQSDAFVRNAAGGERTEVRVRAWHTTATWTLTGEPASFTGVRPRDAFDAGAGHWGAFELGARVNGFEIGDEAFGAGVFDPEGSVRDAFAWGVVVNWYLNRHVKQVVSYERTTFSGGAAGGADRPDENALFFRTQFSF